VILVDERGHIVDGDQLLAVIAPSWKEDGRLSQPGVVVTVMSNLGLERFLKGQGLDVVRTPVGDRYVLQRMLNGGYNLGGEQSGHIILSDYATTGDGIVAALQVLAVVQKQHRPVSEVCHRFDPLPQILKNVRYRNGKPLDDSEVKSAISNGEQRLNGHGRLLIRSSGTETVIRVMGHTDSTGSITANNILSEDRANAVANYLVAKGVARKRFTIEGYGPAKPIADNGTSAGRAQNRRVEIKLVSVD
jgi:phosphoglucosamine mutase